MPSTYTVNLGIEKPATGEQSGTWGDTVNDNSNILDEAINGAVEVVLAAAGSSGSPNQIAITDGTTSTGRNKWIQFGDGGDLGASAYVQLIPNDAEKICFIRNSLTASRSVFLFQGTYNASNDLEIAAGTDVVVKFNGGGTGATVVNVYANLKVDGIVATTADINGGTVDGTVIGGASAAALTATTVVANTSVNIAGDGATVTGIKDEDNMASDSATKLATQQSIKAYVDAQVATVDTLAEVLAIGNTTGATDIDVDGAQKVQFRDAAIYINSSVDGQLDIVADTEIQIAATTVDLNGNLDVSGTLGVTGVATLASLVATTADINAGTIDNTVIGGTTAAAISGTTGQFGTSLNVDGTVTADGLIVGSPVFSTGVIKAKQDSDATRYRGILIEAQADDSVLAIGYNNGKFSLSPTYTSSGSFEPLSVFTSNLERFSVDPNGDISFYEDTGTTARFFWDASTERLGIGTTTPKRLMHLDNAAATTTKIQITNLSTGSATDGDGFQLGISNDGTASAA
jgi:hypothetical protein